MTNEINELAGYVPSAEAVEAGARGMVPPTIDPDRPHGVSREPLWTYYVGEATAALSAAVPVEVARLLEKMREEIATWVEEATVGPDRRPAFRDGARVAASIRCGGYESADLRAVLDAVGVPDRACGICRKYGHDDADCPANPENWPVGVPAQVDAEPIGDRACEHSHLSLEETVGWFCGVCNEGPLTSDGRVKTSAAQVDEDPMVWFEHDEPMPVSEFTEQLDVQVEMGGAVHGYGNNTLVTACGLQSNTHTVQVDLSKITCPECKAKFTPRVDEAVKFLSGPGHASWCGSDKPHGKHRHPEPDSYDVCSGVDEAATGRCTCDAYGPEQHLKPCPKAATGGQS